VSSCDDMSIEDLKFVMASEAHKGDVAQSAYDNFIRPFVEANRVNLFEKFQDIPMEDIETLKECKRMALLIETLNDYMENIISTGKLAAHSLASEENQENSDEHAS